MPRCGFWVRRGLSIGVVAMLLAISTGAQAAPAVVKVFEGTARARPDGAAPVLHVFAEGVAVSVSEDVVDAWRRVRLPDGGVGFIRDEEVTLKVASADEAPAPAEEREAEPAAPVTPLAPPPPPVSVHLAADLPPAATVQAHPAVRQQEGPIFVKDLDHLASLVGGDGMVGPMAQHLVHRTFQSNVVGLTGLVVGGALVVGGMVFPAQDCAAGMCTPAPRGGVMVAGLGVMAAGAVAALLLRPWRGHVLKVVNAWNERHPDDPFTIQGSAARPSGFPSW